MTAQIQRFRERAGDSEKITINLGYVDLGHIDLLVQEEKLHIKVLGLASFAPDVTPTLALATIESITVLGALHASKEIKVALADRMN